MLAFYSGQGPKLMLDETSVFDIGACVVDGTDLSPGRAIPDDGDARIDHSLEGFLFTCGPDHIRHPEPVEGWPERKYPLHGSFSASPAEIIELTNADAESRASARIAVTLADGGSALLLREWHIDGKTGVVTLSDRLTNTGSTAFPPMLMYHMNIGARHFDDGVKLASAAFHPHVMDWTFGEGDGHVFCAPAGSSPASVQLGPVPAIGGKNLHVSFDTGTLPYLQMWRNQARPAHILGIEPASHDWKPRKALADEGSLMALQPGESRHYGLRFHFQ